jgi:hypothetical protein
MRPVLASLVLLVALVLAACGDDAETVTDAGPVRSVPVTELIARPQDHLRETVRITGEVNRVLPDRADLQSFFVDGLLVVGPPAGDDISVGDTVTAEGTFLVLEAEDPLPFGSGGSGDEILNAYEGDPALFATSVSRG